MNFSVFVQGLPKGQPRPRAFARNGVARVYDPGTAEAWKSEIAVALRQHIPPNATDRAVSVLLAFQMPRPKTHLRKDGSLKDSASRLHTSKPDLDNLAKAVLDTMTQLGMYRDDSQIYLLELRKEYATNCKPGCWISVHERED